MPRLLRVYADTSVFGGVFDVEFRSATESFFDRIRWGHFQLVISPVVSMELEQAPDAVRNFFLEIAPLAELVSHSREAIDLRDAYLRHGILTPRCMTDALHVAIASVSACSVIVSWNFKHIVHFQRIPLYNAVNSLEGYAPLMIHSPAEVIENEGL